MNDGTGMNAMSVVPTSGTRTPMTRMTQTTDASAMSRTTVCFGPDTLPNSRIVAQPRIALSTRPANRPATPAIPEMIAIDVLSQRPPDAAWISGGRP